MNETNRVACNQMWTLVEAAERIGVVVEFAKAPKEAGRHLGTLDADTVVLYEENSFPPLWFTLAHLVGHLIQRSRPTPEMYAAIELVNPYRTPGPMMQAERDQLLVHEKEAAELGLALIMSTEGDLDRLKSPLTESDLDYYSRMFWADYHYLCHFIETGEGGAAVFDRFFDAETSFERLSPRYELVDLREFPPAPEARKVVVV